MERAGNAEAKSRKAPAALAVSEEEGSIDEGVLGLDAVDVDTVELQSSSQDRVVELERPDDAAVPEIQVASPFQIAQVDVAIDDNAMD